MPKRSNNRQQETVAGVKKSRDVDQLIETQQVQLGMKNQQQHVDNNNNNQQDDVENNNVENNNNNVIHHVNNDDIVMNKDEEKPVEQNEQQNVDVVIQNENDVQQNNDETEATDVKELMIERWNPANCVVLTQDAKNQVMQVVRQVVNRAQEINHRLVEVAIHEKNELELVSQHLMEVINRHIHPEQNVENVNDEMNNNNNNDNNNQNDEANNKNTDNDQTNIEHNVEEMPVVEENQQ